MSTHRFFLICTLLTIVQPCLAGGFRLSLLGQRQLGMGLASSGLAVDASATYFNPGGLVFIPKRVNILFGATAARPVTRYAGFGASDYRERMEPLTLTPLYLYSSWRGKKAPWNRLALGLAVTTPFGATTRWPDDWKGKFITQEFAINTLYIQPTLSFRLTDHIALGFSGVYAAGNLLSRRAIPSDGPNNTEGSVQFSGTGTGLGFSAGVFFRLSERLDLGITYRSGVNIRIDSGWARFNVPESLQPEYPNQRFGTDLPLPPELSLGLSYRPQNRLMLSFEVQWVGWQRFDSLQLNLSEPIQKLTQYPERAFGSTFNFRIGGEYNLSESWQLRAGTYYDASPVPQAYVSPDLPDANAIGLTAGLGIRLPIGLSIDLSYAYAYTGERTASFDAAGFRGVYRSNQVNLGLGLGYAF